MRCTQRHRHSLHMRCARLHGQRLHTRSAQRHRHCVHKRRDPCLIRQGLHPRQPPHPLLTSYIDLHTSRGPQRPTHRDRLPPAQPLSHQPLAVRCIRIQESVARRIIDLPHIAPDARHRRTQHQPVQCQLSRRLVQRHHTSYLRLQHRAQIRLGLVRQQTVAQHSRRVDHPI
ncbi:hypothetical protein BOTU111921_29340 [Bordetella tumbae]